MINPDQLILVSHSKKSICGYRTSPYIWIIIIIIIILKHRIC